MWLPGDAESSHGMAALFALLAASLLIVGWGFMRRPTGCSVLWWSGNLNYGIWTITAWLLFWRNTEALYGAPLFTAESIVMMVAHVGLAVQGVLLLSFFVPKTGGTLIALGWFALSDLVDYGPVAWGLGWHPSVPLILPL